MHWVAQHIFVAFHRVKIVGEPDRWCCVAPISEVNSAASAQVHSIRPSNARADIQEEKKIDLVL
jgi:hypothetical protein